MKTKISIAVRKYDGTASNYLTIETDLPFVPPVGSYLLDDAVFGNLTVRAIGFGFDGRIQINLEELIAHDMEGTVASLEKVGFILSRSNSPEWKKRHPE